MPVSLGVRALSIFIFIGALALLRAMPPAMFKRFRDELEKALGSSSEEQKTLAAQGEAKPFSQAKALWEYVISLVQGVKTSR